MNSLSMPSCDAIKHHHMIVYCLLNLIYKCIVGYALAGLGSREYLRYVDHVEGKRHFVIEFKA